MSQTTPTDTAATTAAPEGPPVGDIGRRKVLVIVGALLLGMLLAALD